MDFDLGFVYFLTASAVDSRTFGFSRPFFAEDRPQFGLERPLGDALGVQVTVDNGFVRIG